MLPTRVAISEESGSTPIRTEIEPLLDQIDHGIDEEQPAVTCGKASRNPATMGTTCGRPNMAGAMMAMSPRGSSS